MGVVSLGYYLHCDDDHGDDTSVYGYDVEPSADCFHVIVMRE